MTKGSYVLQAMQTAYALLTHAAHRARNSDTKKRLKRALACLEEDPLMMEATPEIERVIERVEKVLGP